MPKTMIEKMEEAAGISTPTPTSTFKMPYAKGEYLKPGEVARPWTGPRPWRTSPAWLKIQDTLRNIER